MAAEPLRTMLRDVPKRDIPRIAKINKIKARIDCHPTLNNNSPLLLKNEKSAKYKMMRNFKSKKLEISK